VGPIGSQTISVDAAAPTSSIKCGGATCATTFYNAAVTVTLSATDADGSGVVVIRYTTNGTDPSASSAAYTAAFSVSTTTTVKFRAWDNAGNVEPIQSRTIQIDTKAPTTTVKCNSATCMSTYYNAPVSVSISATDNAGGSGIAATRYTVDGTTPTTTSPTYSGPFTVSATTTVKFRSWDAAGNAETTRTQTIQIDAAAPTVAVIAPANGSTVSGTVSLQASAADTGGSGVASVSYYDNGTLLGTASTAPYKVNWNTKKVSKGSHTLYAIATDKAGNKTTSAAITVKVA
jgi:hypothetical protein